MADEKILVVDDDRGLLTLMKARLEGAGYGVTLAGGGEEALKFATDEIYHVAILDLKMGEMDGITLMEKLLRIQPYLPVIILSAYGTIATAVEATKKGAYDFMTKPFDAKDLLYRIEKALEVGKLKVEVDRLRSLVQERYHFDNIIASSGKMQQVLRQVSQIAPTDSTVCLYGESGTGKELIAKAVHTSSTRSRGPFVAINCGAIPEGLLESELFGYVKGAFTGADQVKKGLLQRAEGGTLFMDEVAELSLALQVKLLRAFQEREYYPVGGVHPLKTNIRLIAATNQDLEKAVSEGRFREDLYYRIHVIPVYLPPLRDRREDIPLLAQHFLNHFNRAMNKQIRGFSPEVMQQLMLHRWPGNVRELSNVVERAVALACGEQIMLDHLLLGKENMSSSPSSQSELLPLNEARAEFERAYLTQVLTAAQGNVSHAAAFVGRYRPEFYKLIRKYRLNPNDFKTAKHILKTR
ncbi:sigma-54-dependent transcriptional regulator [Desulforhabdus amnigena]|uniref:Transcriptional regulator n=1 Tax=Desulforhabdus amnigena TaxID=40218 RepID=A0A9W6FSQ0_9BACT|nr:sigma-54 dependent transcriptional regulator [Desulforhabdus amnigena]GLI34293.1 transcriptional regulator [Desulforhabdus amnigena]